MTGTTSAPRSFEDWKLDVKHLHERSTELANELRDRWDEWKAESGYATWDECLQAELGMSANALRRRNAYAAKRSTMPNGMARPRLDLPTQVMQLMSRGIKNIEKTKICMEDLFDPNVLERVCIEGVLSKLERRHEEQARILREVRALLDSEDEL